jgi:hypothetical protein
VGDRELETDIGRLDERVVALSARVDDLRGEMRAGFDDVRGELRALRLRVDTMSLAMLGIIATLALKL